MNLQRKGGELVNIDIEEVSVVDAPANKRKFLFFKNMEKADADIRIQSDGSLEGTTITVNGEQIEGLKSFYFNYYKPAEDEEMYIDPVSASYTVESDADGGFKSQMTYTLSKKENTTMDLQKLTKEQIDKLDDDAKNALKILEQYNGHMPEDLDKAMTLFVTKSLESAEPETETETETETESDTETPAIPEDARKELEAMAAQIESILNPVSPEEAAEALVTKRDAKIDEALKLLEKLTKESESEEETESETEEEDDTNKPATLDEIKARLEEVTSRLATVEKHSTSKQGLDDDGISKLDGKDYFPSILTS